MKEIKIYSKKLKKILAITMTIFLIVSCFAIAGCNKKKGGSDLESTTNGETESVLDVAVNATAQSDVEITTGENGETQTTEIIGESTTKAPLPSNPLDYSKEQILEYLNAASNRVRLERPGFTYLEENSIDNLSLGEDFSKAITAIAETVMGWFFRDYKEEIAKDRKTAPIDDFARTSYFGSECADWAMNIKLEHTEKVTIKEENGCYRVYVKLVSEMNPKEYGASAFSSAMLILTPDDIFRIAQENMNEVPGVEVSVTTDKKNINLYYSEGEVSALIDKQGRIVEMSSHMNVNASAKDVVLTALVGKKPLTVTCKDIKAIIEKTYIQKDFKW